MIDMIKDDYPYGPGYPLIEDLPPDECDGVKSFLNGMGSEEEVRRTGTTDRETDEIYYKMRDFVDDAELALRTLLNS